MAKMKLKIYTKSIPMDTEINYLHHKINKKKSVLQIYRLKMYA